MKKINYLIVLLILASPMAAVAQLKIVGEIRPRAELRNGFKKPIGDDTPAAFFIEQRSRLYTTYKTEKLTFKFTLQDVRLWGGTDQIYKTDESSITNVAEAWGEFKLGEKGLAVRVGRQFLSYGDQRFMGALGWAQQSRSHDALLLTFNKPDKKRKVFAGFAYNQNTKIGNIEPGRLTGTLYNNNNSNTSYYDGNYKVMTFIYGEEALSDASKLSYLIHFDGREEVLVDPENPNPEKPEKEADMTWRNTSGVTYKYAPKEGAFSAYLAAYYQFGDNENNQSVSASDIQLDVNYKASPSFNIGAGFEYITGDDSGTADDDEGFALRYGTNHKFNGYMDYFYVGSKHGKAGKGNVGLMDTKIYAGRKFSDKISAKAVYHYFLSQQDVKYKDVQNRDETSSNLGSELDLVLVAKPVKDVTVHLGYSQYFATDAIQGAKYGAVTKDRADGTQNWAWLMVTIKPTIFMGKIK